MHGDNGADFSGAKSYFAKEKRYIADFATGILWIQAKSGRGGSGGGACSPVHQSVKNTFLTDCKV